MSNITLNTAYSGMIILDQRGSGKTTFLNQITSEHPDLFFNMDDRYNFYTDSVIEIAKANNQFLLASNVLLNRKEKNGFIKKGFKILNSVEEAKDFYNNYLNPVKIARKEQEEIEQVMNEKPVAIKKKARL
ncbi:hypothetical protein G8G12_004573 [Salmonella enterica subsp. enterica serovar Infantis]|uniref:hypothetical protein n=1 Tax=Salmonella enterica TaxID=28901 RepID=UPI000B91AB22|nr:hypothetical protein [Salmonella enterica]ECE7610452.1 hypothetical protein [Salmonella enterica subsp. enterica serovar Infantis]MDW6666736.1 hypothetical protein [Escherichia coli]EAP0819989.1 hypothetical protein [Salmonella enterica]EEI7812855.1 hypothetical protein [Salmonella enterica subsp. enterica serovar Infantis]EEP4469536.1 hypothetical protein [Salmonella enterica subsp. enterica serovar Infantis]